MKGVRLDVRFYSVANALGSVVESRRPTTDGGFYMTDKRIVLTTTDSEESARKIARHLVLKRLAACVNIIPQVTSIYRWKEAVEEAGEWLLIVKTTEAAFANVCEAIQQLHSYDLPECVCLKIEDGSPAYLQWIGESISGTD